MDPQESDIFNSSQVEDDYIIPSQTTSQSSQLNQSFHPAYYFNQTNGMYLPYQQYQSRMSLQSLLNAPVVNTQSSNAPNGKKKRVKATQTSINSQASVAKHDCNNSQASLAKKEWTKEEDIALTNAWLYISVDSDVGNNQKNTAMWERILEVWKENMGAKCNSYRSNNSLQCHWTKIQAAVNKFIGHYERLERNPQSGTNPDDLIKKAMGLYEEIEGGEFKFLHCWEIMIKNPKWYSKHGKKTPSNKSNSNINNSPRRDESLTIISEDPMTEGINSDGLIRPLGRKNCKDKKRKLREEQSVVDALNKLQCTLEKQVSVNAANFELRDQVMKKEIELKDQVMKKEIELKENAQKMKMMAQRRQQQNYIMNQDLSKLSPTIRASYETMQAQILKEWENDGLFGSNMSTSTEFVTSRT